MLESWVVAAEAQPWFGPAGVVVVIALIAVLVQTELTRAAYEGQIVHSGFQRGLNIARWPLLAAFVLVLAVRFLSLFY